MSVMLQIRKKWTEGLKNNPSVHFFNIRYISRSKSSTAKNDDRKFRC